MLMLKNRYLILSEQLNNIFCTNIFYCQDGSLIFSSTTLMFIYFKVFDVF